MKLITLNTTDKIMVDDKDFEFLNQFKWCVLHTGNLDYAIRTIRPHYLMHRLLFPEFVMIDHKDGDGLNNQRDNLRPCTRSQNQANRRPQSGTSKYKGVSWEKTRKKWRAYICVNTQRIKLGDFLTEYEAALAYNKAAFRAFGEFARLNNVNL